MCFLLMCVDVTVQPMEMQTGGQTHLLELNAAGKLRRKGLARRMNWFSVDLVANEMSPTINRDLV